MDKENTISETSMQVCDYISIGHSVLSACEETGISHETFYREMRKNPDLCEYYARAREGRADVRFESIEQLKDDLRNGKVDANAARVLLDAIKWQAGKEKAKVYGDKIVQEHTGTLTLAALVEQSLALPAVKPLDVLEHEDKE